MMEEDTELILTRNHPISTIITETLYTATPITTTVGVDVYELIVTA